MNKLLYILSLIFLISCSGEENDNSTEEELNNTNEHLANDLKLKKILKDGQLWREYEYNVEGKKSTSHIYYEGELWEKRIYSYKNDTVIRTEYKPTNEIGFIIKFYSLNETQVRVDYYENINKLFDYLIYTYINSTSCHLKNIEYYYPNGELFLNETYEYTDSNCSSTKNSTSYRENVLSSTDEYEKDDKNYAYNSVTTEPFKLFNRSFFGNILSRKNYVNGSISASSYTSAYTYNENNYPISQVRTYTDGTIEEYTFEYY